MKFMIFVLASSFFGLSAEAQVSSDPYVTSPYISSPSQMNSRSKTEWCNIVDKVILNTNITHARRNEWIDLGHKMDCESTVGLTSDAKPVVQPLPDFCTEAFRVLANPYVDQYLKEAVLEKSRNRGCLR